jgi:hypothetical protein
MGTSTMMMLLDQVNSARSSRHIDVALCEDRATILALLFEHEDSEQPLRSTSWQLPAPIAEDDFDHAAAIAEAESRLLGRGVVLKARPPRS